MLTVLIPEKRIQYSGFDLTILEYHTILNCPSLVLPKIHAIAKVGHITKKVICNHNLVSFVDVKSQTIALFLIPYQNLLYSFLLSTLT